MFSWLKHLIYLLVGVAVIVTFGWFYLGYFLSPQDDLKEVDAIVVVSGGDNAARTEAGVDLYKKNYADLIIFSGAAQDQGTSNAQVMKNVAVEKGVLPEHIMIEELSKTTLENAKNVSEILNLNGIKSMILVTSPYHQRRTYMTFKHIMGDDVTILNYSSTDHSWRKAAWWKGNKNVYLTLSELQKIAYIFLTKDFD